MVDPIGMPASGLALVLFVFNTIVALQQALADMSKHTNEMTDLRSELEDLQKVLSFLRNAATDSFDDFLELDPSLSRCAKACEAFLKLVIECTPETKGKLANAISWTKLKLAKNEATSLKSILDRTMSTISVVLGGINLYVIIVHWRALLTSCCSRRFVVTASVLEDYQRIVERVMADTQQSLHEINLRLDALSKKYPQVSDQEQQEWEKLNAEKTRCKNDLNVFSRVLALLQQVELGKLDSILRTPDADQLVRATLDIQSGDRLTVTDIKNFMEKIPQTTSDLKAYIGALENKMRVRFNVNIETRHKLLEEKQTEEHRLNLLSNLQDKAKERGQNVFTEIRAAERSRQTIISTVEDLLYCKNITAEAGSEQVLGTYTERSFGEYLQSRRTGSSAEQNMYQQDNLYRAPWVAWGSAALVVSIGILIGLGNG